MMCRTSERRFPSDCRAVPIFSGLLPKPVSISVSSPASIRKALTAPRLICQSPSTMFRVAAICPSGTSRRCHIRFRRMTWAAARAPAIEIEKLWTRRRGTALFPDRDELSRALLQRLVSKAVNRVIVDHPDRLHECVTDRCAHELEPAIDQVAAERI